MMQKLFVAFFCVAAAASAAEPVGLLTMLSGNVQIVRAGQKAPAAARMADALGPGDRVLTGRDSTADFLFCPESRAARITAEADVLFEAASLKVQKGKLANERKVPSCRLPTVALGAASQQQAGMLRLRGSTLALRSPSRTNVATAQPTFRWLPMETAKSYEVQLMDREQRVLWERKVSATELAYPPDAPPLAWGQKYGWRVTAREGEDTLAEVGTQFQVLPEEQAKAVQSSAAELQGLARQNPADMGPRFLLAFLYDENGMLDEAVHVYAELHSVDWVQVRLNQLLSKLGWGAP